MDIFTSSVVIHPKLACDANVNVLDVRQPQSTDIVQLFSVKTTHLTDQVRFSYPTEPN